MTRAPKTLEEAKMMIKALEHRLIELKSALVDSRQELNALQEDMERHMNIITALLNRG